MSPVEFAAAASASRSHDRYRLSPREAYVLRSAPIRGVVQAGKARRHGEAAASSIRTMWMVGPMCRIRTHWVISIHAA